MVRFLLIHMPVNFPQIYKCKLLSHFRIVYFSKVHKAPIHLSIQKAIMFHIHTISHTLHYPDAPGQSCQRHPADCCYCCQVTKIPENCFPKSPGQELPSAYPDTICGTCRGFKHAVLYHRMASSHAIVISSCYRIAPACRNIIRIAFCHRSIRSDRYPAAVL